MGSTVSSHSDADPYADVDNPPSRHVPTMPITLPASIPPSKLLEQEPEILLCRAAASPLSPQPSNAGTPRVPSTRVWDPCHIISPPPLLNTSTINSHNSPAIANQNSLEIVLISHGETEAALRPDLVAGRSPETALTARGERQARALAVFLKSRGVRFESVYSSPLDRARATASFVSRELDFPEHQIQTSESLTEMSLGQWEGLPRFEIYTPEINQLIERTNPDFAPPSGESLRQVSFRIVEFLNRVVLRLPEKFSLDQPDIKVLPFSRQNSMNSVYPDQKEASSPGSHWLNRPSLQRKKSGKSRLQFVGDSNDFEDDFSPREARTEGNVANLSGSIGVFTHSTLIKCLITALLDCSPVASQRICIDDSSVTVLEHSLRNGWQIKRMNDTSHLRLL
ncbi:hypothetical protein LUZ62_076438 [Rhynchospora pubera]|uniref:Phosphoglycerate mutase n=1 Tax=Rhynchospora pubera TaxID=906938 RepID=A0AAV8DAH1_9POAL|nr:hypothetical protein LUZ62_076438 [Rhynchospora pubera]